MRRIVLAHLIAAFVVGLGVTAWAQGDAAATAPAAVDVKVRKLISDGGYYYSVGQFQKAVELADAALGLDPNSASAMELKKISQQAITDRDQKNWVREERKDFYEGMDQIKREMAVPRNATIDEGPRWPMIKKRGATVYGPATEIAEQNREINSRLETTVVTADFKAQPEPEQTEHPGGPAGEGGREGGGRHGDHVPGPTDETGERAVVDHATERPGVHGP
jgi:hypothetical protein